MGCVCLPVVQWTCNNMCHPPVGVSLQGCISGRTGTAGGGRGLSCRRKPIGRWWWCGAGSGPTGSRRHKPARCSSSTLWIGNLGDKKNTMVTTKTAAHLHLFTVHQLLSGVPGHLFSRLLYHVNVYFPEMLITSTGEVWDLILSAAWLH